MTFSSMGNKSLSDIQAKLNTAKDINNKDHLDIIKDTSDDLFNLFKDSLSYTEINAAKGIDHKKDLEKLKTVLAEKEALLESSGTIDNKSIKDTYSTYNSPSKKKTDQVENADKLEIKDELSQRYSFNKPNIVQFFGTGLPAFDKFRADIRNIYIKTQFETPGLVQTTELMQFVKDLKLVNILKSGISPELEVKLAKILILIAQLDKFDEDGTTKNQYIDGRKILNNLDIALKQLEALEHLKKNKTKINKRLNNIDALDQGNPKELPSESLDKAAAKTITIPLKDLFIDPAKSLEELPDEYILNTISIKNKDGKDIPLFADATGAVLPPSIVKGVKQPLFVKRGSVYISIGNIELTTGEIKITTNKYADLPTDLVAPFKYIFNVQGIGGNKSGTKTTNHVAITKDIVQGLDKPAFKTEYNELNDEYDIRGQLDKIFDAQYEAQLKDRFYDVIKADPRAKGEWDKLSDDGKNDFFQTLIAGGAPIWSGGRNIPAEVTKKDCYSKARYQADIRKWILEEFTGKTKEDLKKFIFDKLGSLSFTDLDNDPYAIKVLSDNVKDRLNSKAGDIYYLLNHYRLAVAGGTHVAPEELLPDGSLAGEKTLDAAVADSKEIYKESAYDRANKQLEDYYKSGSRFGLKRAKVFFFRGRMVEKAMAKELKNNKGMHIDATSNAATNRWMLEQAMGGEFAANIRENTTVFDDVVFQDRLNELVKGYLENTNSDADAKFASEIQSLIMSNTQLKLYMKDNNITHLGTNLVEQARSEKEERNYYGTLINTINAYSKDGLLNKPQEFDVAIRKQLADFAKSQNKLPDMIKQLDLNMDAVDFAEKIAKHKITLERMKMRNVKLRLRLLTNKSDDEKGLTTAQDVNRDKFDAVHGKKLTKWMEKHPWWTTSITAVGLVGAGIVGTLTAPVLGAGIGAGMLWYMNFLKKRGHYTEEHKKFEQHILAMTPAEREKYLEDMKEKSDKMPKALRWAFSSEYTKYGRSMEYITRADSMEKVMGDLDKYVNNPKALTSAEKIEFEIYLKDALTLLQMHKVEGRNFMFGENGKAKLEEQYNLLHQKTVSGLRRFDGTRNPEDVIASLTASTHAHIDDLQDTYADQKKDMNKTRNKLGIFAGTKSAAIYLGTARLGGLIKNEVVDGWNHIFGNHPAATTAPIPGHTTTGPQFQGLDQAFGSTPNGTPDGHLLLKNVFNNDTAKYQQLVDKLQHLPTSDHTTTLRGSLKDIFGTDQLANAKTHEIFNQFAANITDHNVQELVSQGANVNIHSAQQIAHLMSTRGYSGTNVDAGQIQSLINGFHSGTINLNNLPVGWTKETACNALFCNTQGHQLTDLFFDSFVKKAVIPGIPGGVVPPVSPIPGANSNFLPFGLPTFFNEIRNKK